MLCGAALPALTAAAAEHTCVPDACFLDNPGELMTAVATHQPDFNDEESSQQQSELTRTN